MFILLCKKLWKTHGKMPIMSEAHGTEQLVDTAAKASDRWWEALLAAAQTARDFKVDRFQEANIKSKPTVGDFATSDEAVLDRCTQRLTYEDFLILISACNCWHEPSSWAVFASLRGLSLDTMSVIDVWVSVWASQDLILLHGCACVV